MIKTDWRQKGLEEGLSGKNYLRCYTALRAIFLSEEKIVALRKGVYMGRKAWREAQINAGYTLPPATDLSAIRRLGFETGLLAVRANDAALEAENPWDDLACGPENRGPAASAWDEGFQAGYHSEHWRIDARNRRFDALVVVAALILIIFAAYDKAWSAISMTIVMLFGYFAPAKFGRFIKRQQ